MAVETQTARLDLLVNGEQASEQLKLLTKEANALAKEIDEARDAGNHATARQLTKNLKDVNNKTKELKNQIMDVSKVLNNLSTAKPRELDKVLASLRAKLNSGDIKRGSEAWNKYQASIRRVKEEMRKISSESEVAESRMSRLSNGFNKYFAMITAFVASVTGLSLALRKASEENAKLDDTYSDVMKTTSMTRDEVVALNEEFKKMDTRKSREELNKIAEEAGRIGIAKEDVLEFSKAMNIISVALGDSFKGGVEEIAGVLGKLKFLFKETTDMGIEKAYMSIGSAINDLGANGVATERNIAEFATRMGSLPEALKPPLSSTLALGAAFEESGIEAEIASRAYNIFMRQAATHADKFARVMRLTTVEVEAMINKDPTEFFLKFSEGLRGMDATDVAKTLAYLGVNADGATKVLSSAGDKTERFRELIDLSNKSFREGVSAINEYSIKNNNLQAKLEKSRKAFWEASVALGQRLNPALLKSTDITTYIVRLLPEVIDWFGKYGTTIIKLAVVIGSYIVAQKLSVLWEDRARTATILNVAALKLKTFWLKTTRAAMLLYSAAVHLFYNELQKTIQALKLFAITLKLNPVGAAVSIIVALGIAIHALATRSKQLTQVMESQISIQSKANEEYGTQEARISHLVNTLNNEKIALELRRKALLELKKITPDYHADLTDEGVLINNNTDAIKAYMIEFEKKVRLEASKEELDELYRKKRKLEKDLPEKQAAADAALYKAQRTGDPWPIIKSYFAERAKNKVQKDWEETKKAIQEIEEEVQTAMEDIKHTVETENPNPAASFLIPGGDGENDALREALKKEEERYTQQKADLKKRYAERLETEESFNLKMEEIETEHLEKEKAINEKHGESSAQVQEKIYDRMIQRIAGEKALLDKLSGMYDQFDLKAADRDKIELIRIGQKYESAKKLLDEGLEKQLLSEEQYNDLIGQLNDKRLEAEGKAIRDREALLAAEKMKKLDTDKAIEEAAIAERHRRGLLSEGAYKEELLKMETAFLQKKLALTGLSEVQKDEITKNISLVQADTDDARKKERDAAERHYDLVDIKEFKEEEYKIIEDFEARGVITHEEAARARALIDEKYLRSLAGKVSDVNAKIQSVTSDLTSAMNGFQQAEEESASRKYDKQIAAAEGNARKQAKLEEKKEKELAAIRAKYADKLFIIKIASIGASTALAVMEAYASLSSIPFVGPGLGAVAALAAGAAGAAQIAEAKQARDNAREGYAGGGYTPPGRWDEPQGFVHSDEFVANRFATANPAVRKVFDIVDQAQRNNTVSSLTERDFARALDYREAENRAIAGRIAGAIAPSAGSDDSGEVAALLLSYLQRNADVTERLNNRLDEPFEGNVYIDGPRGVKKNLDEYDRLINNASR